MVFCILFDLVAKDKSSGRCTAIIFLLVKNLPKKKPAFFLFIFAIWFGMLMNLIRLDNFIY